ncbi:MAG: hypothetical protein M3367_12630 [Acidobacteriota bacterium]|nr:hypothetical protein [Acidobacteriota bacterium]
MTTKNQIDITDIILDFDGTCTQIPAIFEEYLEQYRINFTKEVGSLSDEEWKQAQEAVRQHSPRAGWTLGGAAAAPAAADPYILADEAAKFVLRRREQKISLPPSLNADAYTANHAPWREEALDTFLRLLERKARIHFVSNSSSVMINKRLDELFGENLPGDISVHSDAGKFRVGELMWDDGLALPPAAQASFQVLPVAHYDDAARGPGRPMYLRRGAYFEAIYRALEGNLNALESTVFCGDIWEMDLAMPYALGANVHLLERAAPFDTYSYEREGINECGERAKTSENLSGLLDWF